MPISYYEPIDALARFVAGVDGRGNTGVFLLFNRSRQTSRSGQLQRIQTQLLPVHWRLHIHRKT